MRPKGPVVVLFVAGGTVRPEVARSDFGRLLRGYRQATGLTQEELAERAGLSARAIADMERGRTGRPYRRSVQVLADELKLSAPQCEQLVRASRPAAAGGSMPEAVAADPVARELPPAVSHFAGRADELAALTRLLQDSRQDGGAVAVAAIAGTAGVGKTGLATHWAHQIGHLFPDGQLYVNLRGYDPGPPVSPGDALAGFLRALGVPGRDVPAEIGERAGMYRSLLAGRQILILVDNAREAAQVRPLLPGTASCLTVVTSRDSLAGLVARDGARRIELDVLPLPDALILLRQLVGARVEEDPGSASELAERCCRLPLALRVVAEQAAARPHAALADLAAELSHQQARLELLDAGADQATAVEIVFSWSDRQLDPAAARAFRLLGLHPGPDLDVHAMAALTATAQYEASRLLGRLARAHLIQPTSPGRYGMHDLLHRYAANRAMTAMTLAEQEEARARLLDFLQHTATRAEAVSQRETRSTAIDRHLPGDNVTPEFTGIEQAEEWLRAERLTLLAFLDQVTAEGKHAHVARLTAGLAHLLRTDGPFSEARARHATAAHAADNIGDRLGHAHALLCLGDACALAGDTAGAAHALSQARAIFRELGDNMGLASTLGKLGFRYALAGDHLQAVQMLTEARDIFSDLSDGLGVASTLMSLAEVHRISGRFADAAAAAAESVAIFGALGDRTGRAHALLRLGLCQSMTDSYPAAGQSFAEALCIYREAGILIGQAFALQLLGEAQSVSGEHELALHNLADALATFRAVGNARGEAVTLLRLGEARHAVGHCGAAEAHLTQALAIFRDHDEPVSQASVLVAQANLWRTTGDYPAAEQALAQALAISRDRRAEVNETGVLNTTASLRYTSGDLESAADLHHRALRLARHLALPLEEGRALAGLGRCALSVRDHAAALALLQQAHTVLAPTGAAEANEIARELDGLSRGQTPVQ